MADPREIFPILDDSTGAGSAPDEAVNTVTDPAGLLGLIGFSFKDSAGKVVLPTLDASGRLPVTSDASGTCLTAHGEEAAGALALTNIAGAQIVLTIGETYTEIGINVSSLHAALWQVVYVDDSGVGDVETILDEFITGPGMFSFNSQLNCLELDTTGGTGVQHLRIRAKNFVKESSLRATISTLERN